MSTTNQSAAVQQKWTFTFYWIGVIMTVLCVGLACARNTQWVSNLQPAHFPLSWAAGLIAILAFLASEYCEPAPPAKDRGARHFSEQRVESSSWSTEFADV